MERRGFLRESGGIVALGALGFLGLRARRADARTFGRLVPDPAGMVDLPRGFTYRILQRAGDTMSDGARVRPAPDGMAAFAGPNDTTILLRNHELPQGYGGVSRLVLDNRSLQVVSSNDVLRGTSVNCAGGASPWGWLSCEEVSEVGGVWLCPIDAARALEGDARRRIDAYGSFKHEAVALDPESWTAYLTEDEGASHLYRMVPADSKKDPFSGRLFAARRKGTEDFDTRRLRVGDSFEVEWVPVEPKSARSDAKERGAAIFYRGEGIWWFEGAAYFTATMFAQVFKLEPTKEGGRVTLIANEFDSPDNITVAPWGDLYVAEDSQNHCRMRIVEANGAVTDFARNAMGPGEEFAGVCFSPDGKTLFVNLQKPGLTLAITGPFDRATAERADEPSNETTASKPETLADTVAPRSSLGCQMSRGAGLD